MHKYVDNGTITEYEFSILKKAVLGDRILAGAIKKVSIFHSLGGWLYSASGLGFDFFEIKNSAKGLEAVKQPKLDSIHNITPI